MANFVKIGTFTMDAASGTSLTSALRIPGEFSHFCLQVPSGATSWCTTTTVNIRALGADSAAGTFYQVGYSNNPATATSGFALFEIANSACINGGRVISEGFMFTGDYAKLQFSNTATAATNFTLYGRKFD